MEHARILILLIDPHLHETYWLLPRNQSEGNVAVIRGLVEKGPHIRAGSILEQFIFGQYGRQIDQEAFRLIDVNSLFMSVDRVVTFWL